MKRGHISIYILLGTIVMMIVLLLMFISPDFSPVYIEPKTQYIQDMIKQCFEDTAKEGIGLLSLQGGYHNVPEPFYRDMTGNVPYYYDSGKNILLSMNKIETEMSEYIQGNFSHCIPNVTNSGYTILDDGINALVKTEILPDLVIIRYSYPVQIMEDGNIQILEDNIITLDTNLQSLIEFSSEFPILEKEICVSCIHNLAEEFGVDMELKLVEENVMLMEVDNIFIFAQRFSNE